MILIYIYLVIGFIYAMYIWLFAGDPWWAIPFNTLGGPLIFVVEFIRAKKRDTTSLFEVFSDKKAVIFDLDGTIINSRPAYERAMETILESIDAGWVFRSYPHGLNGVEQWGYILKKEKDIETEFTAKELADQTNTEYLKAYQDVAPLPGFREIVNFIKTEKKMKVGLATNSNKAVATALLKRMGIEGVFDFIIGGDEVKKRKPHPGIFKKAAAGLGLKPKDIVVFEDSIVGATSAIKAGMDVIVVWDKSEEREDYPKGSYGFVSDFDGLDTFLEKSYADHVREGVEDMKNLGET